MRIHVHKSIEEVEHLFTLDYIYMLVMRLLRKKVLYSFFITIFEIKISKNILYRKWL